MIELRRALHCLLSALAMCTTGTCIAAAQEPVPVPTTVIYPRDIITPEMIGLASLMPPVPSSSYFMTKDEIVGKMSRMTLLPNRPIPVVALITPRLFQQGMRVRIVFNAGGITASAVGTALEAGSLGDKVRVRNSDSNLIVVGRVESDGSVSVGSD
jgi:flagella basal body P-ring formation protein FlgA